MLLPDTVIPDVQEIELKYREFAARHMISQQMLHDCFCYPGHADFDFVVNLGARGMVAKMSRCMASLESEGPILRTPATWWDHFKLRWFPAWALVRWPAEFTEHNATMLFPEVPHFQGSSIRFAIWNGYGNTYENDWSKRQRDAR